MQFFGFGPTIITRGDGIYLYNSRGKRYVNANSCTWNAALGFGREELIDAATRQMRELPFSSMWGLSHPKAMELAAKLIEITSGNFTRFYPGANGSEATETALKLARNYHRLSQNPKEHDRYKIISLPVSSQSIRPIATAALTIMKSIRSVGLSVQKFWSGPSRLKNHRR
jgi:adenosylmethionine-8-amino-7-oxononanoate aminotransferase